MSTDRAELLAATPQPGDMVAGKFRVERVIAIGGMGVVLAARNEDLDQQVAIKLLRQDALASEESVTRFLREARTAARLKGEYVARVVDVGTTEAGIPYMVMEHLTGQDLQQVLNTRGPLPVRDAVDYILQALEAIAEAHAAGVVHRDLKPSNLFLATRPDGSHYIKVLDFGISKGQGLDAPAAEPGLTSTQQVMGSPGYMSPEQMIRPRDVDGRTDIWSMGVVLHALLTGKPPFQGETVAAVMASILHQPVPRVRVVRSDAPAALDRALERCLERDLGVRFTNVAQVARALSPFGSISAKLSTTRIENLLSCASPAGQTLLRRAETKPEDSGVPTGTAWAGVPARQSSRRKMLLAFGAASTVAGLVGLGVWIGSTAARAPDAAPTQAAATPLPASPSADPTAATAPVTEAAPGSSPSPAMEPPASSATVDAASTVTGAPAARSALARGAASPPAVRPPDGLPAKTVTAPRSKPPKGRSDEKKFLEDRK